MARGLYIGLMSGTSLDGIDAVLVDFGREKPELLHTLHRPLSTELKRDLLALTLPGDNEIDRLGVADIQFARAQAEVVAELLQQSGIRAGQVTAIGSHGQTVRHRPDGDTPFSLQLGDPNTLAELTTICVASDFRRRDLAAGGQGAPLVPAFHAHCFRSMEFDRVIVNIGGMANLTALPCRDEAALLGFDTGPGNVLMDAWIQHHRGHPFDRDGQWAGQGTTIQRLLQRLLDDPYFQQLPPKSTGRERFNPAWLDSHLEGLGPVDAADVQATLLELTARTIADGIQALPLRDPDLFLCGGGAHNRALVTQLARLLPNCQLGHTGQLGIDGDWVEAAAFAWLAMRRLEQLPGNLPGATGAGGERVLGGLYAP